MGIWCEEHKLDWTLGPCPLVHYWENDRSTMGKKINVTEKLTNAPKKRLKDYVAICLDASGSIADRGFTKKAWDLLVEQDANLRKLASYPDRDTVFLYYTFNYNVREISKTLNRSMYSPCGMTALYDAIGIASQNLASHDDGSPQNSFMVVAITDGEENCSKNYRQDSIKALIESNQRRGNWTYVALVPKNYKHYMTELGIPEGNIEEWDTSDVREVERISGQTVASTQSYYRAAAATGVRSTKSFFTPDLSAVTAAKAKSQLQDVTGSYKRVAVPKESRIDVFAAYHTGKDYVPGTVYYPLTKTEKVRPGVELLLREKGTKEVFGGNVRGVLGLQQSDEVRVAPGNHANWDIFIQSESDNRLLVRGTQVLIKQ